jgi:large subunit ribosomal protein L4
MELTVYKIDGSQTSKTVTLNEDVFAIEPNDHAIYLDVKQYLANQRQGTHKAKERAEIARTTKKVHKQKGTGGARHGSMKSPIYRGGGRVFGPQPRDYSFKLNKKVKVLARKSALSIKASKQSLVVLENLSFDAPKTKQFVSMIQALGLNGKKSLVVLGDSDKNVYLSSRNFEGSNVITHSELNTYDIMNAGVIVLVESSIEKIETALSAK